MRSEPIGVARAACFEELAGVFASCGALHYAKILASLKIKKGISSHKKCHFFVRGFQIMDQKRHFEPQTAILAKKWLDSFARIAGCFFCRSKNMASLPYHKDDKTKFTNLLFPLILFSNRLPPNQNSGISLPSANHLPMISTYFRCFFK